MIDLMAADLKQLGMTVPEGMPDTQEITLYGGGALIFDEYGRLKFHIRNRIDDAEKQSRRLDYLWRSGFFKGGSAAFKNFANIHRSRVIATPNETAEGG